LGHFCLHKHLRHIFEDQVFFRGAEPCKEEWQANDFASSILMPESELRDSVRSGITDIEQLAEKFAVSTLALRIRAKNLGFSGHGL
jgi:Zn-dependent peptidase ImmA (M78 family)